MGASDATNACTTRPTGAYVTDAIEKALGHAASFGAVDFASVERILLARAQPRTLDEYVAEETTQRLEQTLGPARTTPRDLTEFDRLPITRASTEEENAWPNEVHQAKSRATTTSSDDSENTSRSSG